METRNQADSLVYQSEKLLNDNADKVPEDLKIEVQGKIDALKAAVAANNLAEMQTAMTELNGIMQRLGEAVYSQSAGAGPGADGPGGAGPEDGGPNDGGAVEGEFREV